MRKYLLTLVGCTLWTLLSVAAPRTAQEAAEIAGRFISNPHQKVTQRIQYAQMSSISGQPMRLAYTQEQGNKTPALYVFNTEKTDGGFVIVSADDNTRAILGYADNGTFSEENMPANIRFWLQMYADEIARAAEMPATTTQTTENTYPIVSPLLGNTVWGQDAPFYNLCPTLNDIQCVTGCVATAVSQIMYYHKHPTRGIGSHSYKWETGGRTLSADFGNTTYDWANMLADYSGNNYTTAQADAVATLMLHTGIACDMEYNTSANGGSSAISNKMMNALIRHFGYDTGMRVLPKDYMDENEMLNLIAQDLQAGHPIFMSGHTTNNEGHAFVCDGMQSNGYLHINWGWDGYCNGHFAISAMNPYGQGTGGAASGQAFTENVYAFTGIQPNQNGKAIPCILANDITYSGANRHLHKTQNSVNFTISQFTNNGVTSISGKYAYLIYKDGVLYTTISTTNTVYTLEPGHFFLNNQRTNTSLSSLSAGNYELSVGVIPNSSTTAYPILAKTARGEKRIPMTVTTDSVFIGESLNITKDTADLEFSFAFIYDETDLWGMNFLQVELQTANHKLQTTKLVQGTSLKLGLIPADRTSITGTYILGNGTSAGTLYADYGTTLDYGNNGTAYSDKSRAGGVTITENPDGNYVFDMELVGNKRTYVATCSLSEDNRLIATYNQAAGDYEDYLFQNKTITSLSVSQAKSRIKALSNDEVTKVPYLVRGIVSQIENTHIVSSGARQFYISDDGNTTNQLYCFDMQWLNNEPFKTEDEIALTDTVVILSYLHNHPTNQEELYKGYVYYHAPKDGKPTHLTESATDDNKPYPPSYVIDIMGRIVSSNCQQVRQAGVYIVRCGDKTTKIVVL